MHWLFFIVLNVAFVFFLLWQISIEDWGEEVEEGAVYHVTLKRVQIQQAANKGARWLEVSEKKCHIGILCKLLGGLWLKELNSRRERERESG